MGYPEPGIAPAADGGSPITGWRVTPYIGSVVKKVRLFSSTKTTAIVNDLHNGQKYRFKVAARNAVGWGPASALSGTLTVGVPGQPVIRGLSKADTPGEVWVSLSFPSAGGSRITHYTTRCVSSNGGATTTTVGFDDDGPAVIARGLTVAKTYRCRTSATNKYGTGLLSKPSQAYTVT